MIALWSASGGVGNLVSAINLAYDEERKRGMVKEKLVALGLTVAAIVFVLLVMALVAGIPVVLAFVPAEGGWRWLLEVVRWVLLAVLVMVALAILYRVAPDRAPPKFRWVSVGAIVATVLWLLVSVGFSLYVSLFANYPKLRRPGRGGGADVAVDHELRGSARRGDQRRGGGTDRPGHDHGTGRAAGAARCGEGRLAPALGRRTTGRRPF